MTQRDDCQTVAELMDGWLAEAPLTKGRARIIVQRTSAQMAAHVGGSVATEHLTFDVDAPELAAEFAKNWDAYGTRSIVGVELLPDEPLAARSPAPRLRRAEHLIQLALDKATWPDEETPSVLAEWLSDVERSPAPEGGETDPVAGARLVEIARIIEDVNGRCLAGGAGLGTTPRQEMTDDEMRAIYALAKEGPSASPDPDRRDELLREAKTALVGMLTFYGMDEDPNEASGAVHLRARAALLSIAEHLGDEPPETGRQKTKIREALGDD